MSPSEGRDQPGTAPGGRPPAPPGVVMPPAPPGESPPAAVRKTQAVADALAQLGEGADPKRVAEAVKAQAGIDLDPGEVAQIMAVLGERAQRPPGPDQPPPEDARRISPEG